MKEFLKLKDEQQFLFRLGLDSFKKKVIFAAIELDVFSYLHDFISVEELSKILNYDKDNTTFLLNALTSLDLLEKQEGKFRNLEISNCYLSKKSENYAGEYLLQYDQLAGFETIDIVGKVKNGASVSFGKSGENEKDYEDYAESKIKEEITVEIDSDSELSSQAYGDYSEMIKVGQRVGRALEIYDFLKTLPEFEGIKKMLDLGAGPGLVSIAIGQRKEDLTGVIFDTPDTVKVADACIEEYALQDRFSTIGGDYMKDDIGDGYDLILAVGTLNFAKHKLDIVMKKIYDSLNDNGIFISMSDGYTDENTKPMDMVLGWLPSQLNGMDFHLEQGEVSDCALKNGFRSNQRYTINSPLGTIDADILRK